MNLLRASAKGDLAAVKKIIAEGGNVNMADGSGRTPLIEAAWSGRHDVVKHLVEKGAAVNTVDRVGYSALMRACEEGHVSVAAYLVGKGAQVNARGNVRGTTPLMLAAEKGHLKILELLIAKGAKVNIVDQHEETALTYAFHANQSKAVKFLESKGGRGKPERGSHAHYSSRDRENKTIAKSMLPKWSAAFESEADQDSDEPAAGGEELTEE
ncbi:MAG: ankyrin repeat domain-containing protein [Chitinispirillaceae bacterium]|nr:ankyrin repeat domain-containing protein [Chitinispirillaceae bacterium]